METWGSGPKAAILGVSGKTWLEVGGNRELGRFSGDS